MEEKENEKDISFFGDRETNANVNEDYREAVKDLEPAEKRHVLGLIQDYQKMVPVWNYQTASACLDIAMMELQRRKVIQVVKNNEKGFTREFSEKISKLVTAIGHAKAAIGIDPKTLLDKREGSPAEAFTDVVARGKFARTRFVFKPVASQSGQAMEKEVKAGQNPFEDAGEEEIENYLATAKTE